MAYIANTRIETTHADGTARTIEVGDTIDDFQAWDYAVQLAHLGLGRVRDTQAQMLGNTEIKDGRLSMGVRAELHQDGGLALEPEATAPIPEPTGIVQGHVCTVCDKSYGRAADLRRHARSHA